MSKSQLRKEKSVKSTPVIATALTIIAFSMLFVLLAVSTNTMTTYAEQTDTIKSSKLINASKDKVWNIISDVGSNPEYWPISIVKNISITNNTIEREVTIPAPPFMDNRVHQIITINPELYTVIENQTQGAVSGVKTISLVQVGNDKNKTEIGILWNLDLSKIPEFGKGFAKDGMSNSVDEALNKIANASK